MIGKTVLFVSAVVFIAYGLTCLISPAIPTGLAGLQMSNGDAFAEVGAMYGGLQTGVGLFCLLSFVKPEFYRAGLVLLVLGIGALALARLFSFLASAESFTTYTHAALAYEFATAILAAVALKRALNDPA